MAKVKPLEWTVESACRELGVSRGAFSSRVATSGIKPDDGGRFTTAQVFAIMHGDMDGEKLRKTREEADKLEMENRKTRGTTIDIEDAAEVMGKFGAAIRQKILLCSMTDEEKAAIIADIHGMKNYKYEQIKAIETE